jgi:uncharacterized protein
MNPLTASQYIDLLQLLPHPEGGWYKETYRSEEQTAACDLPSRFDGTRSFSTAIYFLLEENTFSAFHKIKSDELWHFYAGGGLDVYIINERKELEIIHLGNDIASGQVFQAVVKAGCWFASRPQLGVAFSLVGCTVSPGFDFNDFEMAKRAGLIHEYPEQSSYINELTRE